MYHFSSYLDYLLPIYKQRSSVDVHELQHRFLNAKIQPHRNQPKSHLSSDSSHTPNIISRVFMASKVITYFDIKNLWIVECGANKHMSHNLQWFSSYTSLLHHVPWPISVVASHECNVVGNGTIKALVRLPHMTEIVLLENVLYVPRLQCNLFSTTIMATKHYVHFIGTTTNSHFIKNNEILITCRLFLDMYVL